jgi:response regulator RpfG family c-di-GMP phosphodiesterase
MGTDKHSILIVDDSDLIQGILVRLFSESYECVVAASAEEAIEVLGQSDFSLLMTDINMSGISGFELCDFVQSRWPEIPVIVISGMTDIDSAIAAMKRGAFDYITKPFDVSYIPLAVDRALRYHQLLVSKRQHERFLTKAVRARTSDLRSLNESLNHTLEALYTNYRATLRALSLSLEARDVETRGHSDRVVAYSLKLGHDLQLSQSEMIALEQGALLHDIGKIGVRDSILLKPGPLTPEEWTLMREHVFHGLRIIDGIDFLEGAQPVVAEHHEKFNGSGYPAALAGGAIHLHARIFAVADAFDAITSDRPYRAGQPFEHAAAEIRASSGSHFDPDIVQTFFDVGKTEWEEIRTCSQSFVDSLIDRQEIRSFIVSLKGSGLAGAPLKTNGGQKSLVSGVGA